MKVKTVYYLSEVEVTILSAFIKLAQDSGIKLKGAPSENTLVSQMYSQFEENVNKEYFNILLEDV